MSTTTARVIVLLGLLPTIAGAATITVDAGGAGDFTTIQEAVDAAANLDTVLVYPGTYTDVHEAEVCHDPVMLNVHFAKNIVLKSSHGPGSTIVDGEGSTAYGIVALPDPLIGSTLPPQVVEGFTVTNGGDAPYFASMGIVVPDGEAVGNTCTGYGAGLSSDIVCYPTGIPDGGRGRSGATMVGNTCAYNTWGIVLGHGDQLECSATVTDNVLEYNDVGILVGEHFNYHNWTGTVDIHENTIRDNGTGVRISAPQSWDGWANLIGNEISGNTKGILARSKGISSYRGTIYLLMERNIVSDNSEIGVEFYAGTCCPQSSPPTVDAVLGGSLEAANDIHGSPVNFKAHALEDIGYVQVAGGYNYWGSTLCVDFVPSFVVDEHDDVSFDFLPFTDESHTLIFDECESNPTEPRTWGSIKAMYR